jgi:Protein of unknown function (DUF3102)
VSKKPKTPTRELATIVAEIHAVLRNDSASIIKRGDLLLEAKSQLHHGKWLLWLDENFDMDERTAQRAMAAAKFAAKYDSTVVLNLSVEALYALGAEVHKDGKWEGYLRFPPPVVSAAIEEAKTKQVGLKRLNAIAFEFMPPDDDAPQTAEEIEAEIIAQADAEEQRRAAEEAEANAILDGPPPELPPAEPFAPLDFLLPTFDQAIGKLKELSTKHVSKFHGSGHSASDIEKVAEFLLHVAHTMVDKVAA